MRIGIPKEISRARHGGGNRRALARSVQWLKDAGAETVEGISAEHQICATGPYYIVAPAEASSSARYDGVRYGLRVPGRDVIEM